MVYNFVHIAIHHRSLTIRPRNQPGTIFYDRVCSRGEANMKLKEKPKYSIWQNVCFMVRTAWRTHKRVLFMCVFIAAVQVGLNLAQLYVTPEILAKVEQGA